MATRSITKIVDRAESARRTLANYRRKQRETESKTLMTAEVLAGAAVAGAIDAKFGDEGEAAEVGGVPLNPLLGGIGIVAGLIGGIPGGEHLSAVGLGMTTGYVYSTARDAVADTDE